MDQDPKTCNRTNKRCTRMMPVLEYLSGSPFPETPLALNFTQDTEAITVLQAVVETSTIQKYDTKKGRRE